MRSLGFAVGSQPAEILRAGDVARAGSKSYTSAHGLHVPDQDYSRVVVSPHIVGKVADAYRALPSFDRNAVPAFHAMREEVKQQFDHLTRSRAKGGMGFDVNVSHNDPYDVSKDGGTAEFFNDIGRRRMNVMSTASTGGHPIFTNDENDMFRAVHDVFGHGGTGRGIDHHGEEAAYRKHATMFSPLARQALATETRAQNHTMINQNGEFAEQKVALMPQHFQRFRTVDPRAHERAGLLMQAQQFSKQQGLLK